MLTKVETLLITVVLFLFLTGLMSARAQPPNRGPLTCTLGPLHRVAERHEPSRVLHGDKFGTMGQTGSLASRNQEAGITGDESKGSRFRGPRCHFGSPRFTRDKIVFVCDFRTRGAVFFFPL